MKAVMISIQPKWVEKIASGEKTIEVRKTRPKIETPFKVYIYCTKGESLWLTQEGLKLKTELSGYLLNGKVIGEFVCDRIDKIKPVYEFYDKIGYNLDDSQIKETCLTRQELKDYGKRKTLYGWHISDLVIYDKPKELSEFYNLKGETIKRAYQSWGYINV
jgi:predicted transcriptional regulator